MSVQSEIDRINGNIAATYSTLNEAGATMPAAANSNNLSATAASIKAVLYGKAQSLTTAEQQQARNNIGAISEIDVPKKGVDYFTPADQEAIVQQVIAALGTPVFGTVDENNNVILHGDFVDGTYTFKYEDAEGNLVEIGTINQVSYINQIPISTDTDGSIYNGTGYKTASRCNSSGAVISVANTSAANPVFVTGFIPCKQGDVIRLKNCFIHAFADDATSELGILYGGDGAFGIRSGLYDASKAKIAVESWGNLNGMSNANKQDKFSNYTLVDTTNHGYDGKIYEFTIAYAGTAYIRLTLAADKDNGYTPADAIVTVNQEIE